MVFKRRDEKELFPKKKEVTKEAIEIEAYHIWVKRGKPVGNPMNDWLEAEKKLKGK